MTGSTTAPVLALEGVTRTFRQGGAQLDVLRGAGLEVRAGEIVALVGPSGAGKSTFLHIAGLLERPDAGAVRIAGRPCDDLPDRERTRIRRTELGFVYQFHHLLPEFSAIENVVLPQRIAGLPMNAARERADVLLERLGVGARGSHRPSQLSGGEQQRVAIARALANAPKVLIADEPTGNLDPRTAGLVFDALLDVVRRDGVAALVATHNFDLAARMDRTVALEEGLIRPVSPERVSAEKLPAEP